MIRNEVFAEVSCVWKSKVLQGNTPNIHNTRVSKELFRKYGDLLEWPTDSLVLLRLSGDTLSRQSLKRVNYFMNITEVIFFSFLLLHSKTTQ